MACQERRLARSSYAAAAGVVAGAGVVKAWTAPP